MAPNPTAFGPPRRSRKGSIKGRRNTPDVGGDHIQGEPTPTFFGAVPVEPAPVNFSRDRKSSIGAVNMNQKFTVPALQAASKSRSSLIERERVDSPSNRKPSARGTKGNGLLSLASQPLEPTSLGENTPESSRRMFNLFRTRKPSTADAPKINSPLAPAVTKAAIQSSSSLVQFRKNRNRSTSSREDAGHPTFVPTAMGSSPSLVESTTSRKSLSIINFVRSRTRSKKGRGNPLNGTPIDFRTRKAPDDNGLPAGAIGTSQASPKRSGRKTSFSLRSRPAEITASTPASTRVPHSHTAPFNPSILHDQPTQSATSGGVTNFGMSSQGVKRESSFSFKLKSTETRKPSAPGPSAAQMEIYAPQNRAGASVANAKVSSSQPVRQPFVPRASAPRMEIYAPITRAGVSTASNAFSVQPVKRKKSFGSKSNSTETRQPMRLVIPDIYAPKGRSGTVLKLNPTATQMVKRKTSQDFKLPLTVSRASEFVPSTALNAFAPLESGAFDDLASAIVQNPKTYPMLTLNPKMGMSNMGRVSQTLVPSNPFGSPKMTPAFTGPAKSPSTMRPPSLRDLRVLDADYPRGLVVCPEGSPPVASAHDEQDDNTKTRTPVHELSTVPFPTSDEEPKTYDDDWVLESGADSKHSIYKNLLNVIWAEAKSQQNHGVRQKIIRYSTWENGSKLSSKLAALVSALDSQEYLREIVSELSLKNDKIFEALCEDRRNIRTLLVSTQQEILGGSKEVHSRLLDLVQDVLDDSQHTSDLGDTRLHRLVIKLCSSCERLPSSLFAEGIERRAEVACTGGGFSDIYKAVYRSQEVALKKLRIFVDNTPEERRKIKERFYEEALLWKNLKHPNILPFIGLHSEASDLNKPLSMVMVCPWMPNGTIIKYLKDFPETPIVAKVLEIAQGLNYLHSIPVVHGDLRGSNILVDAEGHARLADFGLACYADATAKSSVRRGSVKWMAPELLQPPSRFQRTRSTDVYALACVINELYNGASDTRIDGKVVLDVIKGERPFRMSIPSRVWKVVEASWCQEPEERLKIGEIVRRLEIIQQGDFAAGTSTRTEPQPRYRPPGALGITLKQNANSTLALTRTASITVTVAPNVPPLNRTRRHSFFELFRGPSADHAQLNWRDAPRALAGFFSKSKTVAYPSPPQSAEMSSASAGNTLIRRPRFLSSPAR